MKHLFSANILLLVMLTIAVYFTQAENQAGCKVISVTPNDADDLELLKSLYDEYIPGLDFWSEPSPMMTDVSIQVCKEAEENLTAQLLERGMTPTVNIQDLQSVIDSEMAELEIQGRFDKSSGLSGFLLSQYHRLEEIHDFLEVAVKEYPDKIAFSRIGRTVENRNMTIVKVGAASSTPKPAILVASGIHAREWISIATTIYTIHKLVSSTDSATAQLLQMYDWYFLPVANPDGYDYTWSRGEVSTVREYYHPRLWRKNRSTSTRSICRGVDLNRNFDIDFIGTKSSTNVPCSPVYRGVSAFSESETKVIKNYATALKNQLKAFVDIHSFGQMWMTPFGYKNEKPLEHNDMLEVANLATKALEEINGTKYRVGTIIDVVYGASGSSVDWAHEKLGVKYAYALEVRDLGKRGFLLPQEEIVPTANEIFVALSKMATEIANREINNLEETQEV